MNTEQEQTYVAYPKVFILCITFYLLGMIVPTLTVLKSERDFKEKLQQDLKEREEAIKHWEEAPADTLDQWITLQMAIVMTESRFNPEAVGKSGDWGIFQQLPIYVEECNRILKMQKSEERYSHEDCFDVGKSIDMFNLMQSHYNPERDLDLALHYQNKASWYRKKVLENIVFIERMEEVRKQLKERS